MSILFCKVGTRSYVSYSIGTLSLVAVSPYAKPRGGNPSKSMITDQPIVLNLLDIRWTGQLRGLPRVHLLYPRHSGYDETATSKVVQTKVHAQE